jgi:hypothetical protein
MKKKKEYSSGITWTGMRSGASSSQMSSCLSSPAAQAFLFKKKLIIQQINAGLARPRLRNKRGSVCR